MTLIYLFFCFTILFTGTEGHKKKKWQLKKVLSPRKNIWLPGKKQNPAFLTYLPAESFSDGPLTVTLKKMCFQCNYTSIFYHWNLYCIMIALRNNTRLDKSHNEPVILWKAIITATLGGFLASHTHTHTLFL